MKIWEIVAGPSGVTVGGAGNGDTIILNPKPHRRRRESRPPQIGYRVRIGNRTIPTPGYNPADAKGTIDGNRPS